MIGRCRESTSVSGSTLKRILHGLPGSGLDLPWDLRIGVECGAVGKREVTTLRRGMNLIPEPANTTTHYCIMHYA